MKTLFVLRHAKAERDSDTGRDFDRPLAKRGWRDAETIGGEMRARGLEPDAVLASPAKRTAETVTAFARGYGPLEPSYDDGIYDAPAARLIDIVRGVDEGSKRLLLVGHNPGIQDLILRLAAEGQSELCDGIADGFPTSAIAALELPANHWSEIRERSGRIVALIAPRDLK
jgi:phosphohistidine phosphatase